MLNKNKYLYVAAQMTTLLMAMDNPMLHKRELNAIHISMNSDKKLVEIVRLEFRPFFYPILE